MIGVLLVDRETRGQEAGVDLLYIQIKAGWANYESLGVIGVTEQMPVVGVVETVEEGIEKAMAGFQHNSQ